jgi:hypothetical protein
LNGVNTDNFIKEVHSFLLTAPKIKQLNLNSFECMHSAQQAAKQDYHLTLLKILVFYNNC